MHFAKHGFAAALKRIIPLLVGVGLFVVLAPAYGETLLPQRSLTLSDGSPGVTAQYKLAFTVGTASTLGSIRLQFCVNDPLIGTPCTPPSGFDAQSATLATQSGETGFTKSNLSTANVLILSRIPTVAQTIPTEYEFTNITNPDATGSYYVRLETFASTDASGPNTDQGGLAFSITNLVRISAEVPPYLTMCAAIVIDGLDCSAMHGSYIDFGPLGSTRAATGSSQLLIATNAANGYVVGISGNTLASGNDAINALSQPDVSRPGRAQFGINLRANTSPAIGADTFGPGSGLPVTPYNIPNYYVFNSGDNIAGATSADDYRKYTVSYLVNVPADQPPGIYVSTVTYVASGNF